MVALGVLIVAGALLRFAALGDQSYWRDEASTVLDVGGSFGTLWSRIVEYEGMPPLYFLLAWPWAKLLGDGEVALRALSALLGTATIPLAWALARRLASPARTAAAGTLAAAFAAFNPFLVWFSQEARAYALLALLTGVAALLFVRALQEQAPGRPLLVAWGAAAAGAVATHWFAAFLVAPQGLALLWRLRRAALPALAVPAAAGLALAPLLVAQRDVRVGWVSATSSLGARVADVAKHWVAGPFGTPADVAGIAAGVLLCVGVLLALRDSSRTVAVLCAVLVAALALPLALALAGIDYVLDRYLIGALVPLLALAAAGLARRGVAMAAGAALAALFVAFAIDTAADERRHREDWRAVAQEVREPPGRAAVVASRDGEPVLEVYLPSSRPLRPGDAVRDVIVASSWRFGRPRPATPPPPSPAFRLSERVELPTMTLVRYVADVPQPVDPAALSALNLDPSEAPALLLAG